MSLWTSAAAVLATGGRSAQDWTATGVSIDTRTLQPGDLFVALADQRDGHDFVAQALEKGAAAALVSRIPEGVDAGAPLLLVDDVLSALQALGRASRERTKAKVIAVTGSMGKTSTKEMLRTVLSPQGRVHAAEASYNNHWGVPLTLARMPEDTDFAVIELGMNHEGEISPLSRLARPHVAMVTNVAGVHLEYFSGVEAIAREKATIFDGLEPGGTAVINADPNAYAILAGAAEAKGAKVLTFGTNEGASIRVREVILAQDATVVRAEVLGGDMLWKLGVPGRHFALNSAAVLAAVLALDLDPALVALDMALWSPPAGRGARERIVLDPVDELSFELIDDGYNANPVSTAAALEVLAASVPTDGIGRVTRGRRIAVLGDMLELGPDETALHQGLAKLAAMEAIDLVHCCGPRMQHLYAALPQAKRGLWVADADELASAARTIADAGDVILVKGSKGSRVSRVVTALQRLGRDLA